MKIIQTDKTEAQPLSDEQKRKQTAAEHGKCMVSRRKFLMYGSSTAVAASVVTLNLFPGTAQARTQQARVVGYPRKLIAKVSQLKDNQPFDFNYPDEGKGTQCMIAKLGVKAGGGIGEGRDIVAFSYMCTHQGGPLQGSYRVTGEHRTLGQCPFHLSTFDLRRHGIIVSGQAYQSLPQVMLEVEGDNIYAVAVLGLLFGRNDNLISA